MPFKTKEQRNVYQRDYYIKNPDKLRQKRITNRNYMRQKRLDEQLNKDAYESDKDFEPIKRYD